MNSSVCRIIGFFIRLEIKIEKMLGMTHGSSFVSFFYSRILAIVVLIVLPISNDMMYFEKGKESSIVYYARNLTFVTTWTLCFMIFMSAHVHTNYNGLEDMIPMVEELIEKQNLKENLTFLICISFRLIIILPRISLLQTRVFLLYMKNAEHKIFVIFLLAPYILMMFASNRISIINHVLHRHLQRIVKSASSNSINVLKLNSMKVQKLYNIFSHHNKFNVINLLAIIGYQMQKISFQV